MSSEIEHPAQEAKGEIRINWENRINSFIALIELANQRKFVAVHPPSGSLTFDLPSGWVPFFSLSLDSLACQGNVVCLQGVTELSKCVARREVSSVMGWPDGERQRALL